MMKTTIDLNGDRAEHVLRVFEPKSYPPTPEFAQSTPVQMFTPEGTPTLGDPTLVTESTFSATPATPASVSTELSWFEKVTAMRKFCPNAKVTKTLQLPGNRMMVLLDSSPSSDYPPPAS